MEEYCDRNMLSPATEWNFTERGAQDQIMPFSCSDSGRLRASEVADPGPADMFAEQGAPDGSATNRVLKCPHGAIAQLVRAADS